MANDRIEDAAAERFRIMPSPYFDVVVDGRAAEVAAPMAAKAAEAGFLSGIRLSKSIHQPDQSLPKWRRLLDVWRQI